MREKILLQYSGGWTYYLNGGVKSDVHDLMRLAGKTVISIDDYSGDGADDVLYRDNASGQLAYVTADHPGDAHVFAADPSVSVVNADLGFSTGSDMLIA